MGRNKSQINLIILKIQYNSNLLSNFATSQKGVPKTAEIKPIEPEQVMLLRDVQTESFC